MKRILEMPKANGRALRRPPFEEEVEGFVTRVDAAVAAAIGLLDSIGLELMEGDVQGRDEAELEF
jgi:hypothetical protein